MPNRYPITTAYDLSNTAIVRIEDATRGDRLVGLPGSLHERCELYPKLGSKCRPSLEMTDFGYPSEYWCLA